MVTVSIGCLPIAVPRGPVDHIALPHSPQKAWAPILCTVVENAASMFLFLFFENTTASLSVVIFAGCLGPVRDVPSPKVRLLCISVTSGSFFHHMYSSVSHCLSCKRSCSLNLLLGRGMLVLRRLRTWGVRPACQGRELFPPANLRAHCAASVPLRHHGDRGGRGGTPASRPPLHVAARGPRLYVDVASVRGRDRVSPSQTSWTGR